MLRRRGGRVELGEGEGILREGYYVGGGGGGENISSEGGETTMTY